MTVSSIPPDAGTVASTTQIDVTRENHPLAGGLANGTYTVFSSPVDLVWGDVSSDGEVVATVFDAGTGQNQPVVFVYETGDLMQGGLTAPAKRVGYFLPDFGLGNLTADGLTLLHAAFNEALAR